MGDRSGYISLRFSGAGGAPSGVTANKGDRRWVRPVIAFLVLALIAVSVTLPLTLKYTKHTVTQCAAFGNPNLCEPDGTTRATICKSTDHCLHDSAVLAKWRIEKLEYVLASDVDSTDKHCVANVNETHGICMTQPHDFLTMVATSTTFSCTMKPTPAPGAGFCGSEGIDDTGIWCYTPGYRPGLTVTPSPKCYPCPGKSYQKCELFERQDTCTGCSSGNECTWTNGKCQLPPYNPPFPV